MPIRILLVVDELMVRALIARAMREEGYDGGAQRGVDAIMKLREV